MSRTPWQDKYLIEVFREDGGSANFGTILSTADFLSGAYGMGPDQYMIPVVGHPDILDPLPVSSRRLADGTSAEPELSGGAVAPVREITATSFPLEFEATPSLIGLFSHLLFQGGFEDDGTELPGDYEKFMYPYTSSTPVAWANVARQLGSGAYDLAHGLLCRRLSLTGSEQSGCWMLSVEMYGRGTASNVSLPSALTAMVSDEVLLFKNTTFSYGGVTTRTDRISISMTNNAIGHHYSARQMDRVTLGPFECSLDWGRPYEGNDLITARGTAAAEDVGVTVVTSGTPYFSLSGRAEPRIASTDAGGAEIDVIVGGRMLHSTSDPITFTVADGVERLV